MLTFLAKGCRLSAWHESNSGWGSRSGEAGRLRAGSRSAILEQLGGRPDSHCRALPIWPQAKLLPRIAVIRPGSDNVIAA
jgi:hypothetical protein